MELLQFIRHRDLPDPEQVLFSPQIVDANGRADVVLTTVKAVVAAVEDYPTEQRWRAAWELVSAVVASQRLDVAASGAMGLLRIRQSSWEIPSIVMELAPMLKDVHLR